MPNSLAKSQRLCTGSSPITCAPFDLIEQGSQQADHAQPEYGHAVTDVDMADVRAGQGDADHAYQTGFDRVQVLGHFEKVKPLFIPIAGVALKGGMVAQIVNPVADLVIRQGGAFMQDAPDRAVARPDWKGDARFEGENTREFRSGADHGSLVLNDGFVRP